MNTEAPEKIYFSQLEDGRQYFTPAIPFEREFVEYMPVDAFIEKAREWLNKESESYVKTGGLGAYVTYEGLDVKELVEDFVKFMKGE